MPTVPTGQMERKLRAFYVRWLMSLNLDSEDLASEIAKFTESYDLLYRQLGGKVARLGALAGFPAPKLLPLSPYAGKVYESMQLAAIQAGIAAGLNATDVARTMFRAGMEKSFKRLNRLARTETVSAYWKNAFDGVAQSPGLVMIWGAEHGPRTCQWCLDRDGLVMSSPDLRDHPNGRCTPIPTAKSEVTYKGSVRSDGEIFWDPNWDAPVGQQALISFQGGGTG